MIAVQIEKAITRDDLLGLRAGPRVNVADWETKGKTGWPCPNGLALVHTELRFLQDPYSYSASEKNSDERWSRLMRARDTWRAWPSAARPGEVPDEFSACNNRAEGCDGTPSKQQPEAVQKSIAILP